jgi:hypothetical protein
LIELFVKNSPNSLTLTLTLPFLWGLFFILANILRGLASIVVHVVAVAAVAVTVVALFISRFKNSGTKVRKTVNEYVHSGLVKFLTLSNVFDGKHFYLLKRVH